MTVKLTSEMKIAETSSKGNQEKWFDIAKNRWYKLDRTGYEALSEAFVSAVLNLSFKAETPFEFVPYRIERLNIHGVERVGCSSANFLKDGENVITLARLFENGLDYSYREKLSSLSSDKKRLEYIISLVAELTGLESFGEYLTLLAEIDALFLNDDRHLNNIAVIEKNGSFDYCPVFDNGAALLSDIMVYRMDIDAKSHIGLIRAAPFHMNFIRQANTLRSEYGGQLNAPYFKRGDIMALLENMMLYYPERDRSIIADRVCCCVLTQQKKLIKK